MGFSESKATGFGYCEVREEEVTFTLDEEAAGTGEALRRNDEDRHQQNVRNRGTMDAYLARIQWMAWALVGMELSRMMPRDDQTARRSEMWLEIEKNPRLYDEVARQLVKVALEAYTGMATSDRIADRMEVVEHEITFRKHVRRLLDNMQSRALAWIQDSFGDWRIMESTVGRL